MHPLISSIQTLLAAPKNLSDIAPGYYCCHGMVTLEGASVFILNPITVTENQPSRHPLQAGDRGRVLTAEGELIAVIQDEPFVGDISGFMEVVNNGRDPQWIWPMQSLPVEDWTKVEEPAEAP